MALRIALSLGGEAIDAAARGASLQTIVGLVAAVASVAAFTCLGVRVTQHLKATAEGGYDDAVSSGAACRGESRRGHANHGKLGLI